MIKRKICIGLFLFIFFSGYVFSEVEVNESLDNVKELPRSEVYSFFLSYGYILLFLFVIYLLIKPLEEYLIKSFLLLLAMVNLTTALLDFLFNLYEGSFFAFVSLSFLVIVISIWSEKLPERHLNGVSVGKTEEDKKLIKSNYFTWSGLWFAFISLELFVPIFWGLIKASTSVFYVAAILVFFVFILYKKGVVDDRFFIIVTSFVFAFFVLNQLTSPIFEPRVNVVEIEHKYYECAQSMDDCFEVGQMNLQVEPAFLGFLPSFGEKKVFNEAVLRLPDDYFIRDLRVEYPCGIKVKGRTSEGVLFGVDAYSGNNRFCLYQLGYERLVDGEELKLDVRGNPSTYVDERNRKWNCSNVTVSNRGVLDVRGYRHLGYAIKEHKTCTCFVDGREVECDYDPMTENYYLSADLIAGEEVTLAVCVR